ncbi:hypothetical protein GZL_04511 [Streptomyces sp. 769]|nr:hypothetical protein GZL_04511 [Streptomyces sp. 769]
MAVWCAAQRKSPGVGGVFAFGLLVVFGLLAWLAHG